MFDEENLLKLKKFNKVFRIHLVIASLCIIFLGIVIILHFYIFPIKFLNNFSNLSENPAKVENSFDDAESISENFEYLKHSMKELPLELLYDDDNNDDDINEDDYDNYEYPDNPSTYKENDQLSNQHENFHIFTDNPFSNHSNYKMFSRVPLHNVKASFRIQGGVEAEVAEFPWAVSLFRARKDEEPTYSCAGSLINESWILTAAHCVTKDERGYEIHSVRLGDFNLVTHLDCNDEKTFCADPIQQYNASNLKIFIHKDYQSSIFQNDIALIKLDKPANLSRNNVATIGLPLDLKTLPKQVTATGWGFTDESKISSAILVKGEMKINNECLEYFEKLKLINSPIKLSENQFCAKGKKEKETVLSCPGDSGSGAFTSYLEKNKIYYIIHGVTSWSPKNEYISCSRDRRASVFVNVYSYLEWILNITKN